jgi:hypothetical protein
MSGERSISRWPGQLRAGDLQVTGGLRQRGDRRAARKPQVIRALWIEEADDDKPTDERH